MDLTWILLIYSSLDVGSWGGNDVCKHIHECCLYKDKQCKRETSSDICKVECSKYHDCSTNDVRLSKEGIACNANCTNDIGACDVECIPGHYGTKCHFGCNGKCRMHKCYRDNGSCVDGCEAGYFGDKCESACNSNCKDKKCDRSNGSCINGCSPGYYGEDCLSKCETSCRYHVCDGKTGNCLFGCTEGFYGLLCQKTCSDDCFLCHPEIGECIIDHIPELEGTPCTTKILVVFWGSAGVFILLAGAAVLMYRSQTCSYTHKKKKRGLDTLFIDTRAPMGLPNVPSQDTRSSHYEEIMCGDTDRHFQHISKSTGSINLRTLINTMKHPNQCNTAKRKRNRANVGRNAMSLASSVHTIDNFPTCWLGSETDFDEMSEHPDKKEAPLVRSLQASQKEAVRFSDAPKDEDEAEDMDTSVKEREGETKSQADDVPREEAGKRSYISAVFNETDEDTMIDDTCKGIYPGLKKED
ncbi:platelet endothelial aggregation receptor 1-like [Haliotis rufescens]|uniref:platelet endothelial aggregation receptor 1-like n=1 Tax=Haliotis rufescens TaxID=6454 RepID=UPI001EB05600|nr:platelet endothelial aggregation receptor 1-like [Haliotis rufescens]